MAAEKRAARHGAPIKVREERYKWILLLVVASGNMVTTIDSSAVGLALPALAKAFDTDVSTIAWVTLAYIMGNVGVLFTLGGISDKVGRGRILILGLIINTALLGVQALSQNVYQLVAARFLQGIGTSMLHATTVSLIAAAFPEGERGRALGTMSGLTSIGMVIGPIFGGIVLDTLNWQAIFYLRIPIAASGLLFAWLFLERGVPRPGKLNLDWLGALLLFSGLASVLLAVNQTGRVGLGSPLVIGAFAAAVVLLISFVLWERRQAYPVLDVRLFKSRGFSGGASSMILHFQAFNVLRFVAPFLLINGLAISPSRAGLILSLNALIRGGISPVTGWLADRLQTGYVASFGLAVVTVGLLLLSLVTPDIAPWLLIALLVLASGGSAFFGPASNSRLTTFTPQDQLGTASATIAASRQLGLSTGTAMAGAVLATRSVFHTGQLSPGAVDTPPHATVAASGDAFLVGAALAFIGIAAALFSARARQTAEEGQS